MSDITPADVMEVHKRLKERYDLTLTHTLAVDDGFLNDCPILVGKAHDQELWLYEDGGEFILDVLSADRTRGTHWHPEDVASAVDDVAAFMGGRMNDLLRPLPKL